MIAKLRKILFSAFAMQLLPHFTAEAATVNYQGYLYADLLYSSGPVAGGFVTVGTLAPGFDPDSIPCLYGDRSCNVGGEYFDLAVADGNIVPIGSGTYTDISGFFSGTGTTSASAGTAIYLFAFDQSDPNFSDFSVLATSSDSSYQVPAGTGTTTINATLANDFTFGMSFSEGVALTVLPFPEPSTGWLVLIGAFFVAAGRRGGRRR